MKKTFGCQACYSGNRTFIAPSLAGTAGDERAALGTGLEWEQNWGLDSGAWGCGFPSRLFTHAQRMERTLGTGLSRSHLVPSIPRMGLHGTCPQPGPAT